MMIRKRTVAQDVPAEKLLQKVAKIQAENQENSGKAQEKPALQGALAAAVLIQRQTSLTSTPRPNVLLHAKAAAQQLTKNQIKRQNASKATSKAIGESL